MAEDDQLSLRQADQIRSDLYGLQDDLDFIKVQLARLPTRPAICRRDARDAGQGGRSRYLYRDDLTILTLNLETGI
jgi:hypothetical protein